MRFADAIEADDDAQAAKLDRYARLTVGQLPANAAYVFSSGDQFADPQGLAAIYAPGLVQSMILHG